MEIKNDCPKKIHKKPIYKTANIKECLQPKESSFYQTLMSEIRNNFILKINKEPGNLSFQSTLPQHLDPIHTSFGTQRKDLFTLADIINEKYNTNYSESVDIPGEQINRKYKKPYCRHRTYGKSSNAEKSGVKTKKLIYWCTELQKRRDSESLLQKFNQSQDITNNSLAHYNSMDIYEILNENPADTNIVKLNKSLSHINSIRLQIKKRTFAICFYSLKNHFQCMDENDSSTVSLNEFYNTLQKIKIKLDKENFEYLLQKLNLIKGESIYYEEALDLLNWKYKFPELPKIKETPRKQHYCTTYQDTMKV